jgi:dolichol-phosphate mannosyltransferase
VADVSGAASVVVPIYREAPNVPPLLGRLAELRASTGLDLEVILVDDDSRDGVDEVVRTAALPWVRLLVRTRERGLSAAVLDGLRLARHARAVVMDADLSHPPERIPELLAALDGGADVAVGSRYVAGGSTERRWGAGRRWMSRLGTALARPLTATRDPLAGYFAVSSTVLKDLRRLDPLGWKIGLELLVKSGGRRVVEVPIHFSDRRLGESKMGFAQGLRYLEHLRRLFAYKYFGGRRPPTSSARPPTASLPGSS